MSRILDEVRSLVEGMKKVGFKPKKIEDISCPVCGYYCLGTGGSGCIDKKTMYEESLKEKYW